jgi:protein-disulfide isomerase
MPLLLSLWLLGGFPPSGERRFPPAKSGDHVSIKVLPDDPVLGPLAAPVTLIEYADFQCPFCRRIQVTIDQVLAAYQGRIRLIHKDLPLDIHPRAFVAAEAARCAAEQQRFWEFRSALFAEEPSLEDEVLLRAAQASRVVAAPFQACLVSHRYLKPVHESVEDALRLGFYSTPTFVINGRVMVGVAPLQDFRQWIDEALRRPGR